MDKLSSYELLSRVWRECSFDEILNYGLSNNYIGSESIINVASEYSDPNKEFSDEELKEIIKEADISLILDTICEKYDIKDIIDELDSEDVLNCFDADDLIDHCEWELQDKYEEERNKGYEEGYEEGHDNALSSKDNELHILREGIIDEKWRHLCDEFGISYYDNISLYKKLVEFIRSLNTSIYKNKEDRQWINILTE